MQAGPNSLRDIAPSLDVASAFGCDLLRVALKTADDVDAARQAADFAAQRGVRLVHQCHNDSAFEQVGPAPMSGLSHTGCMGRTRWVCGCMLCVCVLCVCMCGWGGGCCIRPQKTPWVHGKEQGGSVCVCVWGNDCDAGRADPAKPGFDRPAELRRHLRAGQPPALW